MQIIVKKTDYNTYDIHLPWQTKDKIKKIVYTSVGVAGVVTYVYVYRKLS